MIEPPCIISSSFVNIKDWKNFPQKFHNFWKKEFQDHNFHNKKAIPAATCGSYSLIKEVTLFLLCKSVYQSLTNICPVRDESRSLFTIYAQNQG